MSLRFLLFPIFEVSALIGQYSLLEDSWVIFTNVQILTDKNGQKAHFISKPSPSTIARLLKYNLPSYKFLLAEISITASCHFKLKKTHILYYLSNLWKIIQFSYVIFCQLFLKCFVNVSLWKSKIFNEFFSNCPWKIWQSQYCDFIVSIWSNIILKFLTKFKIFV